MDNNYPPPAYSPRPGLLEDAPPPFEPGSAASVTLIDSKPPDDTRVPPPPKRDRPPTEPESSLPLPPIFTINQRAIRSFELITSDQVKAHLVFLGALARLKAGFQGSTDELWAIYVARAIDRFAAWVSKGLPTDLDTSKARMLNLDELPPLDVLMAWHTYMLNPRVYYEDGVAEKSQLLGILAFPLDHVDSIIDVDTLVALRPSQERQWHFESLTGRPWTCPVTTTPIDTTFVPCPRCENATLNEVFWVTKERTGFAENNFKARCHTCAGVIDRSAMMIRAVCDDIVRVRSGLLQSAGDQRFLRGTILNWATGNPDYGGATIGSKILLKGFLAPASMRLTRGHNLADSLGYSTERLETTLKEGLNLRDGGGLVTRILSYYRCPYYPFSIELCGAVLRQGCFIDKMVSLGWIEPRTFDQDPSVIHRCIARYHAWLEVLSQVSQKILFPTLDIDLAWHTHQLKQQTYRAWTLDALGQFVDHDDKVEENKLSDAFDLTAKYWEGVPFHVFGCIHPPQDKPFDPSEKLSRIFRGKGKHPKFTNPRPDLVSTHDCEAGSTHPSEHNSIVVVEQNLFQTRRDGRAHKHEKWAKQLRSNMEKGKVSPDGWEAMSLQRSVRHDRGYMRPMPDPILAPIVPYGPETCAAQNGGVINGANLASTPMDGRHSAGVCAVGMGLYGVPPMAGFRISPTDADPEQFATALEGAAYLTVVM